jgi:hypothetical protein
VSTKHWRTQPLVCVLFAAVSLLSNAATAEPAALAGTQKPDASKAEGLKTTPAPPSSPAASSQTLSRILASWKARQERIHSFHFSWDSRVALPKGFAFIFVSWDTRSVGGLKHLDAEIDHNAVEFAIPKSELWVEGTDRVRDDYFEVRGSGGKDWKPVARIRKIVDGTTISRLFTPLAANKLPAITIWRQPSVKDLKAYSFQPSPGAALLPDPRTVDWAPLRVLFRPLDPALGWSSTENCRIVEENVLVDGARCVKVQMDAPNRSEMWWVDPGRDDIIVRWERREGRSAPVAIAIEYQRDKEHGWVPSRWKRPLVGRTPVQGSIESTVTHFTINEKFPADTFERSAPAGTRVCDVTVEGLAPGDKEPRAASAANSEAASPSMDTIVAAWKKRQEQAKSLKFSWREERASSARGSAQASHSALIDGGRFAYVEDNDPYPPEIAASILASETGARKPESGGRQQRSAPPVRPARSTFDGTSTRTYRALSDSKITGIGSIKDGFNIPEARNFALEPVLLTFRPFDSNLVGFEPGDYRVSRERRKIGEATCVILEPVKTSPLQTFYWLDPARDYIVLRKQQVTNGTDSARLDISYRKDPAAGWVPDGCRQSTVDLFGEGWVSNTSTITPLTVNQPILPQEFLVEFPKGTKVKTTPKATADARPMRLGIGSGRRPTAPARPRRPAEPRAVSLKPIFDPFGNPAADVEAALTTAKEANKRVLILFGDNSIPDCQRLYTLFKDSPELAPVISKGFVLVLVDLHSEHSGKVEQKYFEVPAPIVFAHIGILDAKGENLQFQTTDWLCHDESSIGYDVPRIKRLLSYWLSAK